MAEEERNRSRTPRGGGGQGSRKPREWSERPLGGMGFRSLQQEDSPALPYIMCHFQMTPRPRHSPGSVLRNPIQPVTSVSLGHFLGVQTDKG